MAIMSHASLTQAINGHFCWLHPWLPSFYSRRLLVKNTFQTSRFAGASISGLMVSLGSLAICSQNCLESHSWIPTKSTCSNENVWRSHPVIRHHHSCLDTSYICDQNINQRSQRNSSQMGKFYRKFNTSIILRLIIAVLIWWLGSETLGKSYRDLYASMTRLKNSFYPRAMTILNQCSLPHNPPTTVTQLALCPTTHIYTLINAELCTIHL